MKKEARGAADFFEKIIEVDNEKIKATFLDPSNPSFKPNPLLPNFLASPIDIMFLRNESGEIGFEDRGGNGYLLGLPDTQEEPWRIIDAVIDPGDRNELILKINLNHTRDRIIEDFSKLLTLALKDLSKHGAKRRKISNREFDLYLKVYELKNKRWTFERIAKEIFPRDFKLTKDGGKYESAIKKVQRFHKEAKKLIEGS